MSRKTQVTILEILLVIVVAILVIIMSIKFFSQHTSRQTAGEKH